MSKRVTRDRVRLPTAIDVALWLETRVYAKVVQQPVRLEPVKVAKIGIYGIKEWRRLQPYCLKRKRRDTLWKRRLITAERSHGESHCSRSDRCQLQKLSPPDLMFMSVRHRSFHQSEPMREAWMPAAGSYN